MKAGRLVSMLLLLQTRGRMTAAELATELEVSVRTVYRDAEALGAAGVPLYADPGHHGGYRLLGGYRTRLTGLSSGEAEALFLSGVPGPAAELGLGPALAAAQLKLRAALPPELRAQADRMRTRFHLDAPGWYADETEVPFLPRVADAVWRSRVVEIRYRRWREPREVDRRLRPYGLVLKAGRWYLVAAPDTPAEDRPPRTYRADQILGLTETGTAFELPAGFDLAAHWQAAQRSFHDRLHRGTALVRLSPRGAGLLTGAQARALADTGEPDPDGPDGWLRATLPVEAPEQAVAQFLGLGADAEVLGPPELRLRIAGAARAVAERYAAPVEPQGPVGTPAVPPRGPAVPPRTPAVPPGSPVRPPGPPVRPPVPEGAAPST
ncbi:helix-turn-helix transcriptional regulator [Streptomyces sp. NPDC012888]|uniref:helix-turn-helix transcriptional regulator n=1 Tax=Streptomyces sp. NPDC012888 TaxID=3364855 RepID=UPI003677E820